MKKILALMLLMIAFVSCKETEMPAVTPAPEEEKSEAALPSTEDLPEIISVSFPDLLTKGYRMPEEDDGLSISNTAKLPLAAAEFEYSKNGHRDIALLAFCESTLKDANTVYFNYEASHTEPIEDYYLYERIPFYTEPVGDDELYKIYFKKDILVYPKGSNITLDGDKISLRNGIGRVQKQIKMPENTQIEQVIDGRYIVFTAFESPYFSTFIYDISEDVTRLVADLVCNPILSPDLEFLTYCSPNGKLEGLCKDANGLDRMAHGLYVMTCETGKVHIYSYPKSELPKGKYTTVNWVDQKKVDVKSICSFRDQRHHAAQDRFFSSYVANLYYRDIYRFEMAPITVPLPLAENIAVGIDDFEFGRYLPLLSLTRDGRTEYSILSKDGAGIEEGMELYRRFNACFTDEGQTVYTSHDMMDRVVLEGDLYTVFVDGKKEHRGSYNGESPELLVFNEKNNNKNFVASYGGKIIETHNTNCVTEQVVSLKYYDTVGDAESHCNVMIFTNDFSYRYDLVTPKSYSVKLDDGGERRYEGTPILFDGEWQLVDISTEEYSSSGEKRGEAQGIYAVSLDSKETVFLQSNAYDPMLSYSGRYLSYRPSPDSADICIKDTFTGKTARLAGDLDSISVVGWIDSYLLDSHLKPNETHVLKDEGSAAVSVLDSLTLDIPAYKAEGMVSPSEFKFGKYMPFVDFAVDYYTNGMSDIGGHALLGSKAESVDEGRVLYNKFDAIFKEEYPRVEGEFNSFLKEEGSPRYRMAYDMLFKSRVMYISEDAETVGNLSLLYSETNHGKKADDLLFADWDSKYDIITHGKTVSTDYTVAVDYQALYSGFGYKYYFLDKEIYVSDVTGEQTYVDELDGYIVDETWDDSSLTYHIYSKDTDVLKYRVTLPKKAVVNGVETEVSYYLQNITDDGGLLLEIFSYRDEDGGRYCAALYDTAKGSLSVLENYAYQPRLSPDGKYLLYTSPTYAFDPYSGTNGLFDMWTGFYVKNLEDGTTVMYRAADYMELGTCGWVDEESVSRQIGGYTAEELQAGVLDLRGYRVEYLEGDDNAPVYDLTDEVLPDEAVDLTGFDKVDAEDFDFGGWCVSFFDSKEGVMLGDGIGGIEEGRTVYAGQEKKADEGIHTVYYGLFKYGSEDDNAVAYGDNLIYTRWLNDGYQRHVFSVAEAKLKYSVICGPFSFKQADDGFFTVKDEHLVYFDLKTEEKSCFTTEKAINIFSPDGRYVFSADSYYDDKNKSKTVIIRDLKTRTAVEYPSDITYGRIEWVRAD